MAISMEWVGEWLQNIPYSYNQVVRHNGIAYVCVSETTVQSTTSPAADTANWNIFSTPGTSGTSGNDGTSGESGTSGISGTSGASGTSGTSGSTDLRASRGWNINKEYEIESTEQFTFAGDYVLDNSYLYIDGTEERIGYSENKLTKKRGKIYIGGNLIVKDSSIENNGEISVGGGVILIGNSQITGTGIII